LYAAGDVRVEERPDPTILEPTDAIIRVMAACVCGSDLWPFRGAEAAVGYKAMDERHAIKVLLQP
jgi:threonine dehydrogenase-like Zn-dependent dehydrogenase